MRYTASRQVRSSYAWFMFCAVTITAIVLACLCSCHSEYNGDFFAPPSSGTRSAHIHICVPPDAPTSSEVGMHGVLHRVQRYFKNNYTRAYSVDLDVVSYSSCPVLKEPVCTADNGQIYCDAVSLARALTAIAFLSAAWAFDNGRAFFTAEHPSSAELPLGAMDALRLTDGLYINRDDQLARAAAGMIAICASSTWKRSFGERGHVIRMARLVQDVERSPQLDAEYLQRELNDEPRDEIAPDVRPLDEKLRTFFLALEVYETAVNLIMSYIFGHELAHAHGACGELDHASVEERGLVREALRAQRVPAFSCDTVAGKDGLNESEVAAESCGLRMVKQMDAKMRMERVSKSAVHFSPVGIANLMAVGRTIALHTSTSLLAYGLHQRTRVSNIKEAIDELFEGRCPKVDPDIFVSPGYMLPAFRSLMLMVELQEINRGTASYVEYCGGVATVFLKSLDGTARVCGVVDGQALQAVRSGVAKSLSGLTPELSRVLSSGDVDSVECQRKFLPAIDSGRLL